MISYHYHTCNSEDNEKCHATKQYFFFNTHEVIVFQVRWMENLLPSHVYIDDDKCMIS